jgi:hypothetical protein
MSHALDKSAEFRRADRAWDEALAVAFGRNASTARYSEKGAGPAGSALRRIYSDRWRAYAAWCEACGMIPAPDALVEPLAAPIDVAARYEISRNDPAEPTYSTAEDMAAAMRDAFAAGWQFDQESAAENEWPWFRIMAEDDGRCVMHNGEWRLYVETAAEAVAETADA